MKVKRQTGQAKAKKSKSSESSNAEGLKQLWSMQQALTKASEAARQPVRRDVCLCIYVYICVSVCMWCVKGPQADITSPCAN